MKLGRNEKLHLSCSFSGREKDCPNECSRCAIFIKNNADIALSKCVRYGDATLDPNLGEAIKLYKKALFIEPYYADAWCGLAEAYKKKHEYNNAISAFDKAISIDPQYGEAMLGKARVLQHQGKLYAALEVYDDILSLYEDSTVNNFKWLLEKAGIRDGTIRYSLQEARDALTEKAREISASYDLLDKYGQHSIGGLDKKEACAGYVYSYWKRSIYDSYAHKSGDMRMVWRNTLRDAFYGAIFITLNYYIKTDKFTDDPFEYLCSHEKDHELQRAAEEMMGVRGINAQLRELFSDLWKTIQSFISYAITILGGIEPSSDLDAAVKNAAENAYVLGALFAARHYEQIKQIDNRPTEENTMGKETRPHEADESRDNGLSLPPILPPFHPRKLSYYGLLEPIEVLHENTSTDTSDVSSRIVAETADFYVYSYYRKSDRSKSLIRQSKRNLNEIVYLGHEFDSVCFFNGLLFYITPGFAGGDGIASIDINTGKRTLDEYNWFSKKTIVLVDVGINQDIVKSLHVENGKLIIDVSRSGSSYQHKNGDEEDLFDVHMDYKLSVRVENGKYVLTRLYTNINTSLLQLVCSAPRQEWSVATANDNFFLIDNKKNVAKTPQGYVLQTSYLDLAKSMANDLEQYGDNPPEMTPLALHMYMQENIVQNTREEVKSIVVSYFEKTDDWIYHITAKSSEWANLFGKEKERKQVIESWLSGLTHMQMNAVFALGRKYKSLNLPYICAVIIEKISPTNRRLAFSSLAKYVAHNSGIIIQQNDLDVYSSYYEIQFKSDGPSIVHSMLCVNLESLLTDGTLLKTGSSADRDDSKLGYQLGKVRASFCHKCGKQLSSDMLFCPYCGTKRLQIND